MRILLVLVFLFNFRSMANEPAKSDSGGKVLDFNADVIEGDVKRPQLFFELGGDIKDLDSILYMREDFNDFHAVDMKKRLIYIKN